VDSKLAGGLTVLVQGKPFKERRFRKAPGMDIMAMLSKDDWTVAIVDPFLEFVNTETVWECSFEAVWLVSGKTIFRMV
jgi:UDP-N-acetyl-D-mannosaminuronate dehydrogenase